MNVAVRDIRAISPCRTVAIVQLGDEELECRITETNDGGVVSYSFDSLFFDALFHFDGIGARFSWDYWPFRRGEGQELPWDYGDHDPAIVNKAEKISGIDVSAVRRCN